jgi:hypothetical protein
MLGGESRIWEQVDQVASEAWQRLKTPLDRMYDQWLGEDAWLAGPSPTTFRVYDRETDAPMPCHLCGSTERWVVEGDEVRRIARVFVCEHEPVWAGVGMIRQISTIPARAVGRCEVTSTFRG